MKLSIEIASTISALPTFGKEHPFDGVEPLATHEPETQTPNYKEFIPPIKIRRLSPILRMSLTTAIKCVSKSDKEVGAIIIGTSLGCMRDTQSFLKSIHSYEGGALSPTAFINSTHNTVSGQISLFFKNHGYNITHAQNNLSFEMSIIDCMNTMQAESDIECSLVGSTDENIPFLEHLRGMLIDDKYPLTEISTTLLVGRHLTKKGNVIVDSVKLDYSKNSIDKVLEKKNIDMNKYDLILHSGIEGLITESSNATVINYLDYCGMNLSASAFAFHFAFDLLKVGKGQRALIINNLCPESTGITELSRVV